ncbi:MAG: hypothetical protein JWN15_3543, partial [Firmicutes bacterium]|nr:hypothetical protein [Bacillota bacterium]
MGTGRRIAIVFAAATLMLWQAMPAAWAS